MRVFSRPALIACIGLQLLAPAFATVWGQQADVQATKPGQILPGDIVRLRIWREPDLSGEFQVNEAGVATFPKLGPMSVGSETAESLSNRLVSEYQQFLRNPSVEVVILKRINVLGAVKNPGLYPVDPTMTIADAVAVAGGASSDGDRKRIELIRNGARVDIVLTDQTRIADLPLRSGDQIFVPERSWISRSPGVVAASLSAVASLVIALLLR